MMKVTKEYSLEKIECRTLLLQDIPLPDNGGPFANDYNAPGKPGEPPKVVHYEKLKKLFYRYVYGS